MTALLVMPGCSEGSADQAIGAGPASWYVTIDGERHGPFDAEQLVTEVSGGRYPPWAGHGRQSPECVTGAHRDSH